MKIKLSKGDDLGHIKNVEIEWSKISKTLSTHEQADTKGGKYFVGGYFNGTVRKEDAMIARTLLTLDVDKIPMSVDAIEWELSAIGEAMVAYSTFSHGVGGLSSLRVVMPLSREVTPSEYRQLSKVYAKSLSLSLDECSFKPNQAMFFPTCPDLSAAWSYTNEGDALDVDALLVDVDDDFDVSGDDDLEMAIAEQPLDITDEAVVQYLKYYPAVDADYSDWIMVGAALHHQFKGGDKGYELWLAWSKRDKGRFDLHEMQAKWRSFGNSSRMVTFASVIFKAKQAGGIEHEVVNEVGEVSTQFEALMSEAAEVVSLSEYRSFKDKVSGIPSAILPNDLRSMLAQQVVSGFGKREGITKTDIKKAIAPRTTVVNDDGGEVVVPEWLDGWVYIETSAEFHDTALNYSIKREAFNAKFDREPDCLAADTNASTFALVLRPIPTVVDKMYWPSADRIFQFEGKAMLNSYTPSGVEPCSEIDDDAQSVIDLFLAHLAFTLADEREQTILLDWMTFVVQNAGKRINWALLLQGAQGTGKTYFINVLQLVLGHNVANLDPTSISGRFTGWAHGSLVLGIEEIRISGTNKYEVLDRMKPFITNKTVMIEEKGRDHRTVPNFTNYFPITNHRDALPIGYGDRRWCILEGKIQSEDELFEALGGVTGVDAYFDKLFTETNRRADALARFLKTREISARFNPDGRAPHTNARDNMIQLAVSPERTLVEDAIHSHECGVVSDGVLDVSHLKNLCEMEGDELPYGRKLSAILVDMGYSQIPNRRVKIAKTRKYHYVWVKGEVDVDDVISNVRDFHDDPNYVPF